MDGTDHDIIDLCSDEEEQASSDSEAEDSLIGDGEEEEEEDEDDYDDDSGLLADPAPAASPCAPQHAWTVLDRVKLEQMQAEALEPVTSVLGCSSSTARLLLMHFRWDSDLLFGAVAERGMEYIYRLARVISNTDETPAQPSGNATADVTCGTCFCDVAPEEATAMECGHAFCNDCWQQHCRIQISEGRSRQLACMAAGCGAICDESKVKKLIADAPDLLQRYSNSLLDSYVDDNKRVKWCPSVPHCGRAVQVDSEPHCEPTCECGHQFCFACCQAPHTPCSCEIWRRWLEKTSGESENKTWMTANTKPCPKCQWPVEKSSGCNHVTCRCGQHFCWLCGAATGLSHTWTSIAAHTCGRYKEEADQRIADAARDLKRYHHYLGRWEAHVASQKLEEEQTKAIQEKIAALEALEPGAAGGAPALKDFTWLTQALEQLFVARRILGYSYVACFYMFDGVTFAEDISPQQSSLLKNLFEDAQEMLEMEVERLSKLIEAPADDLGTDGPATGSAAASSSSSATVSGSLRLDIINSTVNIDARLTKLYDLLENEILSRVTGITANCAPYKGQSTLRSGSVSGGGPRSGLSIWGQGASADNENGPPSPPQKAARRASA